MKKRLAIYFFYDADGIVDRYVDYMLAGIRSVAQRIVVVCNGTLTPEGRDVFLKHTVDIIVRKNEGLDVWAYKTALEYVGWDELREMDEVILMNATIMGPVFPFSEMFDKMAENEKLDFWGPNLYLKTPDDPFGTNPYGYLPDHIQSSFIVYRKKFLKSPDLRNFWNGIPEIKDYNDSIGKYESFFTKYFADMGYRWGVYVDNTDEKDLTPYYLMYAAKDAVQKHRCPIFKRRSFFQPADSYLSNTMNESASELFRFLKEHTDYNTDLILENLIRTCNQADIVRTLGLHYILPSRERLKTSLPYGKIALVIHAYYEDQIERTLHYASSVPESADIYITLPKEKMVELYKEEFSKLPNKVYIRTIENRGRDVSGLLVGVADVIEKYEFVCFYHDKKVNQISPKSVGSSFCYKVSESTLHSKAYVENILGLFEKNPLLGMLSPLPPNHADYYFTLSSNWDINFQNTANLAKKLGLHVPISRELQPVAPLGTVFWFRRKAMQLLFDQNWQYSDFPQEPNGNDGTLLHAIERIYPLVVQNAGYYPAYVMPDFMASIEINNLNHYLATFNDVFMGSGIFGMQYQVRNRLKAILGCGEFGNTVDSSMKKGAAMIIPQRVDGANALIRVAACPPYGVKEALLIAINKRFPFLFKKAAARIPSQVRSLGLKDTLKIWCVKKILGIRQKG